MITAYGDAETKRKALENGAEALLTKPIDFAVTAYRNRHAGRASGLTPQHDQSRILLRLLTAVIGPSRHLVRRKQMSAFGITADVPRKAQIRRS